MGQLGTYTEQQARFDIAFRFLGSCCDIKCEACGRTYFVTSPGHGDYMAGELDALRAKAELEPEKYIEVDDFGSISFVELDGKQIVVGCLCDPTKRYSDWIESHARQLTDYLKDYWATQKKNLEAEAKDAAKRLEDLAVEYTPQ